MRKIMLGLLAVVFVSAGAWVGVGNLRAADEAVPAGGDEAAPAAADAAGGDETKPAPTAADAAGGDETKPAPAAEGGDAGGDSCCKAGDTTPPLDLIKNTPKGGLHNPYNDQVDALADEGRHKYLSYSCNGCHGGGGGGGMCPPLTNDTWIYSADDDTLFRLIALGTDELQKDGYGRVKHEVVVGPMPPFGKIIKTSDDMWKVIAFIRAKNPNSMKDVAKPYAPRNY